jgi:lysophospholipase L1-like esterase
MPGPYLFIGDSLIEFFNWQKRFPDREIYNFGSAGETAEGLLARLPDIIRRCKSPELIMIMTGTNNLAMEDYGFLTTNESIIDLLQLNCPKTAIVITSLLPVQLYFLGEAVPRINAHLQDIAREKNILFLNLYPIFLGQDGKPIRDYFEIDGVHLSERGYETWAGVIEERVFPALA